MVKCVACAKYMSAKDGVTCPKCSTSTHRECVGGFPVGAPINSKWRCVDCHPKMPKGRHPGTPIMQDINLPTDGAHPECEPVSRDAVACILVEMRAQFESMKADLLLEFQSFKDELREIRPALGELKKDQTALKTDLNICVSKVSNLKNITTDLENYLGDKRNTVTVTTNIGVTLEEREIVSIERSGASQVLQKDTTLNVWPRKVVIRFSSRITRDTCLQRARERRGLTSADLGLEGPPARLFINERLTKLNRQLFAKAKEESRHHQWRYCWAKNGRIYLRK
ncbi:Zinc finger DNA binding protein [Operophtera brumata]|uniref:Zinc finger DNA binding protein n=1 Tax=Operophtera brumata TaxID=104452 RepID=A0A0L7KJT4_OPEBR|nr:Zinc finger DNA binding protein [Operophtera brumata]